jgi:hypothetical protein
MLSLIALLLAVLSIVISFMAFRRGKRRPLYIKQSDKTLTLGGMVPDPEHKLKTKKIN